MSESATEETSGMPADGSQSTDTSAAEPVDGQLGEAGERTLKKLRSEVKELQKQLKAYESANAGTGDPASESSAPSDGSGDPAADADVGQVAMTGNDVTPNKRRFLGTADGGALRSPGNNPTRQLSRADLNGMSAKQIDAARRKGQLRDLMSGRN
ncbi:hypothetical protein [Streptomyces sp. N35]|uniref:hypothetical protein n=1 Tax=Streptomyces sp. N35 TaxID=2795730 RepID=UPI0018F641B7|nr:hypothetical protein [Streptomyces sp. N35]